jgi:hypothetical protein
MRRLRPSSLIALTVALSALVSASAAMAEEGGNPLILPEPTAGSPLRFTSLAVKSATVFTNGGLTIECQSGTSTGEFTSKRAGVISMSAKNCISIAHTSCKTTGAEAGTITFSGATIHLVAFQKSTTLRLGAVVKLPSSLIVNCTTGSFEWRGSVLGVYEIPLETLTKSATWIFGTIGETKKQTECDLDKEFCFTGETHKKFLLELNAVSLWVENEMKREDSVTFEKEAKFFF